LLRSNEHFRRTAPAGHQTRHALGLSKILDVLLDLQREVVLALALLNVRAVKSLYVLAVKGCLHWRNAGKKWLHLLQIFFAQHAGFGRRLIGIVFEYVPPAEDQVFQIAQRDEFLDQWRSPIRALSQADRAELR